MVFEVSLKLKKGYGTNKANKLNAEILKRLFRAVSEGSDKSIQQVCGVIVQDMRRKNHSKLADQLETILKEAKKKESNVVNFKNVQSTEHSLKTLPTAKRTQENLISILSRQELEHYMVLPQSVEERFKRIEQEYAARDRLANFGFKPRKKILLYGPPGTGKTLGAKRLAWNTGLRFVKVRFDVMISSMFGESASNLRTVFDYCMEQPSLLLLDECDFIARSRTNSKDIGEVQRIVNTLLQLLEDYSFPGLVVATTNLDSQLDHALFRRFDDAFEVPLPGENEITKLLNVALSSMSMSNDVNINKLSKTLVGLSSADIVKISQNAAKNAILSGEKCITADLLQEAIVELRTSP